MKTSRLVWPVLSYTRKRCDVLFSFTLSSSSLGSSLIFFIHRSTLDRICFSRQDGVLKEYFSTRQTGWMDHNLSLWLWASRPPFPLTFTRTNALRLKKKKISLLPYSFWIVFPPHSRSLFCLFPKNLCKVLGAITSIANLRHPKGSHVSIWYTNHNFCFYSLCFEFSFQNT